MSELEDLTRDYRTGFLRYLPRRSEAALTAGYELGRRAATTGAGLLDLVRVHHDVLGEVLSRPPLPDTEIVMDAGCEFLSEVLSTFEMAHRVLHDPPPQRPRTS
ncbi:MAG: phosphatase RsbU N-terminal domain-containing protein [Ornithinibacter sp.]